MSNSLIFSLKSNAHMVYLAQSRSILAIANDTVLASHPPLLLSPKERCCGEGVITLALSRDLKKSHFSLDLIFSAQDHDFGGHDAYSSCVYAARANANLNWNSAGNAQRWTAVSLTFLYRDRTIQGQQIGRNTSYVACGLDQTMAIA